MDELVSVTIPRSVANPDSATEVKAGFSAILKEIADLVPKQKTLQETVHLITTFNGRQSRGDGLKSLSCHQRAILAAADGLELSELKGADFEDELLIGVSDYGRLVLKVAAPPCAFESVLLSAKISNTLRQRIREVERSLDEAENKSNSAALDFFENCDPGVTRQIVRDVRHAIDTMDPILIYINDETFTNFDRFNNLFAKRGEKDDRGLFSQLENTPGDAWTCNQKIFIYCFHILMSTGFRGEEFNGSQLTVAKLTEYLVDKYAQYGRLLGLPEASQDAALQTLAANVKERRLAVKGRFYFYRWVNGLTFYKEERVAKRRDGINSIHSVPGPLAEHLRRRYDIDPRNYDTSDRLFQDVLPRVVVDDGALSEAYLSPLEEIIQLVVSAAIEELGCDIGMSRGLRDLSAFQTAVDADDQQAMCDWETKDYYCAAFPSAALKRKFKSNSGQLIKVLKACSGRMQFNSWHYMPGHCDKQQIPPDRHYYRPPRMSDTAVWSDQHHAGHVLAQVRYSIRSPASITYLGSKYYGMVDIRLMRQEGRPFSFEELERAREFTAILRSLSQALCDHLARSPGKKIRIDAFTKQWYDEQYRKHALCEAAI